MTIWLILTGGESRRMGQDKAALRVGDATLVDRAIAAVGDHRIVGPEVRGGPAHALVSTARELDTDAIGVLAVDMPFAARIVPALREAWSVCAADALLARDERPQWLCGMYRRQALLEAAREFPSTEGLPMWRIGERLTVEYLPVTDTVALFDVDTPTDLEWATRRLREESVDGERDRTDG